jgi:NAD(P)H-hydrate epimerase
VIDADGLNCLAQNKDWLVRLTPYTIITPHPKEFDRLFGDSENDFQRMEVAQEESKRLNIIIVLKGHHTFIALPDGTAYFNTTGNAGMAKGGSGDVLTGIITAFCAQGYTFAEAAILGVYLHGLAGNLAAKALSKETMLAGDLIHFLHGAFRETNGNGLK